MCLCYYYIHVSNGLTLDVEEPICLLKFQFRNMTNNPVLIPSTSDCVLWDPVPEFSFLRNQTKAMRNFLISSFKWVMLGLGCLSFVLAIYFWGHQSFAFRCSILAALLFVFASIVGLFMEDDYELKDWVPFMGALMNTSSFSALLYIWFFVN